MYPEVMFEAKISHFSSENYVLSYCIQTYTETYHIQISLIPLFIAPGMQRRIFSGEFFPASMKVVGHQIDEIQVPEIQVHLLVIKYFSSLLKMPIYTAILYCESFLISFNFHSSIAF